MNRRETALLLLALGISPRLVLAQAPSKQARVVYVIQGSVDANRYIIDAFTQRLRELGYAEGKNLILDIRPAMGDAARLAAIAREIAAAKPDVILVGASTVVAALQKASATSPIVMAAGDVAGLGLVKNLARPEGNITGVSALQVEIGSKLIELALAINPKGAPIGVLGNPSGPLYLRLLKQLQSGAAGAGVKLLEFRAQSVAEIDQAFAQMAPAGIKTLVAGSDGFYISRRQQITELAARNRIASIFARREYVDAGGLMSYGSDLTEGYRMAATYVDRILKGAKVADLPVQQPTKLELVVNLKTAKAIGVTIPRDVLLRADVTIQ